jgi:cellulose synthase/poly-beta-1,6-N-acetylglucosamine synthase-like glycosyltransferase
MIQVLEIIAFTCVAIFTGFYLFYLALCIGYVRDRRRKISVYPITMDSPKVSIIIPSYNEALVIPRKIKNLQTLHYPKDKLEVVFVDGGSTDGTADLIEKLANDSVLSVKIVQQGARKGFNNAVIEGFANTRGEIICITGAETEYDPEALRVMVDKLSDPKIGLSQASRRSRMLRKGTLQN